MSTVLLPLIPGTLPVGYCFSSWQKTLIDFASVLNAQLPGSAFYNYGDTKPTPENQAFPWLRTTDMLWYRFEGLWLRPHEFLTGRHTWEEFAAEADIWAFDGGDGSNPALVPPTANTGAMWQLDTNYSGRSPMSPGTIPSNNPVKVLGFAENYGVGTRLQNGAEVGVHKHGYNSDQVVLTFPGTTPAKGDSAGNSFSHVDHLQTDNSAAPTQEMTLVHPVRGMCCIVRTARQNRTVP